MYEVEEGEDGGGFGWLGPLARSVDPLVAPAPPDLEGRWASSGALSLTGTTDAPLVCPRPILDRLWSVGEALRSASASHGHEVEVDPFRIVVERAAHNGQTRRGTTSCGGQTRLLEVADGWIALSLAREDDADAVPAWISQFSSYSFNRERYVWDQIAVAISGSPASAVVSAGRLLGLPLSAVGEVQSSPYPLLPKAVGPIATPRALDNCVVVDLSSLWAGPLCSRLLAAGGASIIKVESATRPDGARRGNPEFFDALNGSARSVALDFDRPKDRAHVVDLVRQADVVIEGSRPRALEQLGLGSERSMAHSGAKVWVSITGYGRSGSAGRRVAFGDDAAVAGGLVAWNRGVPNFVLDAVADPLSGLIAGGATLAALRSDRRWLLDVPLARVAAWMRGGVGHEAWTSAALRPDLSVTAPETPEPCEHASALGADTAAVLSSWRHHPPTAARLSSRR